MNKILPFLMTCLLLASCHPEAPSVAEGFADRIQAFENQLEKDLKDDNLGGSISAILIKGDHILWAKAFGYTDQAQSMAADTSTLFRTGSISKSITAFMMMQLVEEGIIERDDPVALYLPEVRALQGYADVEPITFQHLASHRSGLIREPELRGAASGPYEDWENKIHASIPATRFQSLPDERYSYSNIGYGILGLALSRAARQPFDRWVEDKIFKPLGMQSSFFQVPEAEIYRLAEGINGGIFEEVDRETPRLEHQGRGYKVPNGGIYSTPNDLAKFMMAAMGYIPLLKEASHAIMQSEGNSEDGYGLGFFVEEKEGMVLISHGGAVAGYTAHFVFDKNSEYGVALMRNYNRGLTNLSLRAEVLLRDLAANQSKTP